MNDLIEELKFEIVDCLGLCDVKVEDIDENEQLIGGGLGLDSIDSLELIMMMDKKYGVKIPNPAIGKDVFASIASMAKYISENTAK